MLYYHIYIEWRDWKTSFLKSNSKKDRSIEQLIQFIDPIKNGSPILFDGWRVDTKEIWHLEIWETIEREQGKSESSWDWIHSNGKNITNDFVTSLPSKPSLQKTISDKTASTLSKEKQVPLRKDIFIVHGRDHKPMKELKILLKEFGLNPIVLHEQPSGSRTIVEKLEKYSDVGYAFVILTPDDRGGMYKGEAPLLRVPMLEGSHFRVRQNVILEFGYFMGLLGRDKVCCLLKGDVERPSDMHGIVYIPFKESVNEVKDKIVKELKEAGYDL